MAESRSWSVTASDRPETRMPKHYNLYPLVPYLVMPAPISSSTEAFRSWARLSIPTLLNSSPVLLPIPEIYFIRSGVVFWNVTCSSNTVAYFKQKWKLFYQVFWWQTWVSPIVLPLRWKPLLSGHLAVERWNAIHNKIGSNKYIRVEVFGCWVSHAKGWSGGVRWDLSVVFSTSAAVSL